MTNDNNLKIPKLKTFQFESYHYNILYVVFFKYLVDIYKTMYLIFIFRRSYLFYRIIGI